MEPATDPLEAFVGSPVALAFAFLLGTLFGSFANVCIARVPLGMSVVRPGSHCFACQAPVAWYDNLPLVSYLLLRGKCRRCGAAFSPRYLLVELATGLLFAATWHLCTQLLYVWEPTPRKLARFAIYALYELTLVVITFIDLDHKRIPDRITYPAIPLFLGLGLLLGDVVWYELLIGVVSGYGLVRLISDGYYHLTKREGLGYGDGKLLAVIGALCGWRAVVVSLFGGALLGSVIGVVALVVARRAGKAQAGTAGSADGAAGSGDGTPLRHVELPFGPFIVAAALLFLFLQERLSVELFTLFSA
jgi:leader peptidase (prepilin peptidase)/N-methyltransferase